MVPLLEYRGRGRTWPVEVERRVMLWDTACAASSACRSCAQDINQSTRVRECYVQGRDWSCPPFRGTSLIRYNLSLGLYSRLMPRALRRWCGERCSGTRPAPRPPRAPTAHTTHIGQLVDFDGIMLNCNEIFRLDAIEESWDINSAQY